jgi:hypothetical protein
MARAQALSLLSSPSRFDVHYHPGEGPTRGRSIGLIGSCSHLLGVSGGELLDAASLDAAAFYVAFEAKLAFIEYQSADQILVVGDATYASAQSAEMAASWSRLATTGVDARAGPLRRDACARPQCPRHCGARARQCSTRPLRPEAAAWKRGSPSRTSTLLTSKRAAANLDLTAEEKRYAAATQSDVVWVNEIS